MAATIQEVMTTDLTTCPASTPIADAARLMRDRNIGEILVVDDDEHLTGLVTDRDLVVRCLAEGAAMDTPVEQAGSRDLATLSPDDTVDDAMRLMRERSIRRLPVVSEDHLVGIVSLGDLAIQRDPNSVLGDISAARPNN